MAYLGVKQATLYTYVSRGWVRSLPANDGRCRRYVREDLERLKARRDAHRGGVPVAKLRHADALLAALRDALDPDGERGGERAAHRLAGAGVCFESAAESLWTGAWLEAAPAWARVVVPERRRRDMSRAVQITSRTLDEIGRRVTPLATVRLGVSVLLCLCHARAERPGGLGDPVEEARALMSWMAALAAVRGGPARVERALAAQTVAERLDAAFATAGRSEDSTRRIALIDRALVLSAAGDFDVPALVARATATAGGDLCACVIAGLDALSGSKPVEACDRLEDVLATLDDAWAARRLPRLWNERGRSIPGFGEAPEPGGDPVVQELLTAARSSTPWSRRLDTLLALIDATAERGMGAPTPAVGIVALSAALDLPPGAAALITALGRTAGLIAHVLAEWAE